MATEVGNLVARMTADMRQFTTAVTRSISDLDKMGVSAKQLDRAFEQTGRGIQAAISRIAQDTRELGKNIRGLTQTLEPVTRNARRAFLGLSAALAGATWEGARFSQAMANVASVAGATDQELRQLTRVAREMGRQGFFAATQVADAMYFLASAGYSAQKQIAAIPGITQLAAATQTDLAQATEVVVSALNAFGLAASESNRVANVFAAAISASQATLERLQVSLRYTAPVFAQAGRSIEENVAALALLYNAGFQGEQAGTALRGAIARLLNPTKEMADVAHQLGLSLAALDPTTRSLADILGDLRAHGITAAQAITLFGTEAGPGMLALISQGGDALRDMERRITGTSKAAEMASRQMDTLQGDLRRLRAQAQEAGLVFFESLEPVLRRVVQSLTGLIEGFNRLSPAQQGVIVRFTLTTVAGLALASMLGTLVVGVGAAVFAAGALLSALAALMSPIGILILLVGGLALAWATDFGGLRGTVTEWAAAVAERFGEVKESIRSFTSHWAELAGEKLAPIVAEVRSQIPTREETRKAISGWWEDVRAWASTLKAPSLPEIELSLQEVTGRLDAWWSSVTSWAANLVAPAVPTIDLGPMADPLPRLRNWWENVLAWSASLETPSLPEIRANLEDVTGRLDAWWASVTAWAAGLATPVLPTIDLAPMADPLPRLIAWWDEVQTWASSVEAPSLPEIRLRLEDVAGRLDAWWASITSWAASLVAPAVPAIGLGPMADPLPRLRDWWATVERWAAGLQAPEMPAIDIGPLPDVRSRLDTWWQGILNWARSQPAPELPIPVIPPLHAIELPAVPPEVQHTWDTLATTAAKIAESVGAIRGPDWGTLRVPDDVIASFRELSGSSAGVQLILRIQEVVTEVQAGEKSIPEAIIDVLTTNLTIPIGTALIWLLPMGTVWKLGLQVGLLALQFVTPSISLEGIGQAIRRASASIAAAFRALFVPPTLEESLQPMLDRLPGTEAADRVRASTQALIQVVRANAQAWRQLTESQRQDLAGSLRILTDQTLKDIRAISENLSGPEAQREVDRIAAALKRFFEDPLTEMEIWASRLDIERRIGQAVQFGEATREWARQADLLPPEAEAAIRESARFMTEAIGGAILGTITLAIRNIPSLVQFASDIAAAALYLGRAIGEEMVLPLLQGIAEGLGNLADRLLERIAQKLRERKGAPPGTPPAEAILGTELGFAEQKFLLAPPAEQQEMVRQLRKELAGKELVFAPAPGWVESLRRNVLGIAEDVNEVITFGLLQVAQQIMEVQRKLLEAWSLLARWVETGSVTPPGFQRGAVLPGRGGEDRIPALLAPGEAVVPAWAVRRGWQAVLEWFRYMRVPGFQQGGLIDPSGVIHSGGIVGDMSQAVLSSRVSAADQFLAIWTAAQRAANLAGEGGPTGEGGTSEVAGVVHRGEWVAPAWMVRALRPVFAMLEGIRRRRGFQAGGAADVELMPGVTVGALQAQTEQVAAGLQQAQDQTVSRLLAWMEKVTQGFTDALRAVVARLPEGELKRALTELIDLFTKMAPAMEEAKQQAEAAEDATAQHADAMERLRRVERESMRAIRALIQPWDELRERAQSTWRDAWLGLADGATAAWRATASLARELWLAAGALVRNPLGSLLVGLDAFVAAARGGLELLVAAARDFAGEVIDQVPLFKTALQEFTPRRSEQGQALNLAALGQDLGNQIGAALAPALSAAIGPAGGAIAGAIGPLLGALGGFLGVIVALVTQSKAFQRLMAAINRILQPLIDAIVVPLVAVLEKMLIPIFQALAAAIAPFLEVLMPVLFVALKWLGLGLMAVTEVLLAGVWVIASLWNAILELPIAILRAVKWLFGWIPGVGNTLQSWIDSLQGMKINTDAISASMSDLWQAMGDLAGMSYEAATQMQGAGDAAERIAGVTVSEITGPTRDLLVSLLSPLTALTDLVGGLQRIVDAIWGAADRIVSAITGSPLPDGTLPASTATQEELAGAALEQLTQRTLAQISAVDLLTEAIASFGESLQGAIGYLEGLAQAPRPAVGAAEGKQVVEARATASQPIYVDQVLVSVNVDELADATRLASRIRQALGRDTVVLLQAEGATA